MTLHGEKGINFKTDKVTNISTRLSSDSFPYSVYYPIMYTEIQSKNGYKVNVGLTGSVKFTLPSLFSMSNTMYLNCQFVVNGSNININSPFNNQTDWNSTNDIPIMQFTSQSKDRMTKCEVLQQSCDFSVSVLS